MEQNRKQNREKRREPKQKRYGVRIFITFLLLVATTGAFVYFYLQRTPQPVVKLESGNQEVSIDNLYLSYQLKTHEYKEQKEKRLPTDRFDTAYWSQKLKDGSTREEALKKELLKVTKEQLIILEYAKENHISLDAQDEKLVNRMIQENSSDEQIRFVAGERPLDERIYRKLWENIVLRDKTITVGADKEQVELPKDIEDAKVVVCEELVVNVGPEDDPVARKAFAEKLRNLASGGEDLTVLAGKFNVGYKSDVKLTLHDFPEDDPNRETIRTAVNLKEGEISPVVPYYEVTKPTAAEEQMDKTENSESTSKPDVSPEPSVKNDSTEQNPSTADGKSETTESPENPKSDGSGGVDKRTPEKKVLAYFIFRLQKNVDEADTEKNRKAEEQRLKEDKFKKQLLDKVNQTDFMINEHLFELLQ